MTIGKRTETDPYIEIKKIWFDEHVIELEINVCDKYSKFSNTVYTGPDDFKVKVKELTEFKRRIHGGIYDLKFGEFGPEYANGGFTARFHFVPSGKLEISTYQQSDFEESPKSLVASEAKLYLRTEPALLDRFVDDLKCVTEGVTDEARLECI